MCVAERDYGVSGKLRGAVESIGGLLGGTFAFRGRGHITQSYFVVSRDPKFAYVINIRAGTRHLNNRSKNFNIKLPRLLSL